MTITMLKTSLTSMATTFLCFLLMSATALSQKTSNVTVTNTAADPVPVTGSVSVTTIPGVQLDPNGNTVKLDSNANTVRLAQNAAVNIATSTIANVESFNWTGQSSVFSFQWTERLSKARVCVAHTGANQIVIGVNSLIGESEFAIDQFSIASPNTVCRIYEIPGEYLYVRAHNTGANAAGLVRIGYWGIY